jgi:hypothetical protein
VWFALFGICLVVVKDRLGQFAALLLLSLLPMYHQRYDLVAAVPALAVFLQRGSLFWPALMSAALATDFGILFSRFLPAGTLRSAGHALEQAYYPLLTLAILAGLICVELRRARYRGPGEAQG